MARSMGKIPTRMVPGYHHADVAESAIRVGGVIAGRYLLERQLGEGGMGTVWEAMHTVTRRSVAMKFLKSSLGHQEELRKRFLREASAASALQHPNVVEILDIFDFEERLPVLVMELLRGETLGSKLQRDEKLSLEETAVVIGPVVSAVSAAHALGVVHRDIKPENIFLSNAGRDTLVKVLDFGIAKLAAGLSQGQHREHLRGGSCARPLSATNHQDGNLLLVPADMIVETSALCRRFTRTTSCDRFEGAPAETCAFRLVRARGYLGLAERIDAATPAPR
jgi:serine/threonine protein kinase